MNLRLFVAIYPPARIASSLSRSLGELVLPEHRRVPVEQIHLTLCRFRTPSQAAALEQPLSMPAFGVDRIVLMRSTLTPQGARHQEVIACPLE